MSTKTKATPEKEAETTVEAEQSTEKAYDPNELVDYIAPLLPGKKQRDIFGAVNGETFCVKRGVPVKIKRKFLEALNNAQIQQYAAYQAMAEIQKQGGQPSGKM